MNEYQTALEVLKILEQHGTALVVGGAVRDKLFDVQIHDVDIATNVSMEVIESLFETFDIGKNKDFGVVVIKHKNFAFEVANFRSEGDYSNGRYPDKVVLEQAFEKDSQRRDFTINSLAMDSKENIVDYQNGKQDIENKIIRTVGNPNRRFEEDYLRMLRAVRFASRLSFLIEEETFKAIQKNAHKIVEISPERISQELYKMAGQTGYKFANSISLLKETGLLEHVLPEIDCMDMFEHMPEHHPEGNCFQHSVSALRASLSKDPVSNFCILFHDVGKPLSFEKTGNKISYNRHEKIGLDVIDQIVNRLKFDNDLREVLIFTCKNHMKMTRFLEMKNSKILKMVSNKNWRYLLHVGFCDRKARGYIDMVEWSKIVYKAEDIRNRYVQKEVDSNVKKAVSGNRVMKLLKLESGKRVGEVISATIEWVVNKGIDLNDEERIDEFIKTQKRG